MPWVLSKPSAGKANASIDESQQDPRVFNRYYHMFAEGELAGLASDAVKDLGFELGPCERDSVTTAKRRGVEIVQNGWERSNYYVELRCWEQ